MPFYVDVELTVIDRMSATFFGGPPSPTASPPAPLAPQNQMNITVQCADLNAILR